MSPEFFIENVRRLHKSETDIAETFRDNPHLWKRHANLTHIHNMWKDDAWVESFELGSEDTPENGSAKRLAHVLHIQHLLGTITAEMPHIAYDDPHKQTVMARIALELYKTEDFSNQQTLTEFLQWSPEALLMTALSNTEPTIANIDLKERGLHNYTKRSVLARQRRGLLQETILASTNETALASKALKTYLRYFPISKKEHRRLKAEHEQKLPTPSLDETDFK
ncbi:MAG TPA: hypothetical protein VFZ58_01405 [Candidatus Saccharimonadales bacterium]